MNNNSEFIGALELSREYFHSVAEPKLKREFPELYPRLAAGLAGNGSECFGYDDELSRDHDWGVDFFIWTTDGDKADVPALRDWKNELFKNSPPEHARARSDDGARADVMTCGEFYSGLIGTPEKPKTNHEFIRAPEENFAIAVNGAVFIDGPGEFTRIRNDLLDYFPEDIRRKRIAAKCMALAQTGQYNHERIAKRCDWVTLRIVLSRFTDNAIAMTFLLNKVYKPYYKWFYRALRDLPILGGEVARLLLPIAENGDIDEDSVSFRQQYIEELCSLFVRELKNQGLSASDDWFLTTHGEEVQSSISDSFLRSLPATYDI
jgi:hypothetical protein